jgi:hypothetical protein
MARGVILLLFICSPAFAFEERGASRGASVVSNCGKYRMSLSRQNSGWHDQRADIDLRFDLEIPEEQASSDVRYRPQNTFLEKTTVISAQTQPDHVLGKHELSAWSDNRFSMPRVTVRLQNVGERSRELHSLVVAVTLIKVKSWETIAFADLGQQSSGFLNCGPFQLVVRGDEKAAHISVAHFADFDAEVREYQKRMPLHFLNHAYGFEHIVIHDAKQRVLVNTVVCSSGGSSNGTFVIPTVDEAKLNGESLEYPLRVEVRLPVTYDTEHVVFDFTDLPLPARKNNR